MYIYIHNLHLWTCWVTRSSLVVEPSSTCIWPNKNKAFNQQKTRNHRYLSVWKWQLTHETMVMTRIIRASKLPTSVELLCSWACDDDPWFETCTHTHIYIYTHTYPISHVYLQVYRWIFNSLGLFAEHVLQWFSKWKWSMTWFIYRNYCWKCSFGGHSKIPWQDMTDLQ